MHIDCLMSRLSRNADYYTVIRQAIILEEGQTVEDILESDLWLKCRSIYFNLASKTRLEDAETFYIEHKEEMKFRMLWEEKWDCFKDIAILYWENRKAFMSELMNDATSIGEKWFKTLATETEEEMGKHRFIKTMLSVDSAVQTTKKSDYTSILVGSQADNGFYYIRESILKRLQFEQYCLQVVLLLEKFTDICYINIEKNTYNGADVLKIKELIRNNPKLKKRHFVFINQLQRKNKDEKISTIIDIVNNGQVIFNSLCEDFELSKEQLLEFQGQKYSLHDDLPDNLAELIIKMKEIKIKPILKIGTINDLYR